MKKGLISVLLIVAWVTPVLALPQYKIESLGLDEDFYSVCIANNGLIAYSTWSNQTFIGTLSGGFQQIAMAPGLSGMGSYVTDINDAGQITGKAMFYSGSTYTESAFISSLTSGTMLLANSPGSNFGIGHSINRQGTVGGTGARNISWNGTSWFYVDYGPTTTWSASNGFAPRDRTDLGGTTEVSDNDYISANGKIGRIGSPVLLSLSGSNVTVEGVVVSGGGYIIGHSRDQQYRKTALEKWDLNGNSTGRKLFSTGTNLSIVGATDDGSTILVNGQDVNGSGYGIWNPLTGNVTFVQSQFDQMMAEQGWDVGSLRMGSLMNDLSMRGFARKGGVDYHVLLTPVPEPATVLALGVGVAAVLRRKSKRRVS